MQRKVRRMDAEKITVPREGGKKTVKGRGRQDGEGERERRINLRNRRVWGEVKEVKRRQSGGMRDSKDREAKV